MYFGGKGCGGMYRGYKEVLRVGVVSVRVDRVCGEFVEEEGYSGGVMEASV